jgi:membrane-associated protease RseP (regulator of RpoE activity)
MFMEPTPTAYDLRWHMFGIPVRVHPMFWLISVIMGWGLLERGMEYLLIWIGCLFVSILIHELGHVWMGQLFGSQGHIVLYGFGGLAIGSNQLRRRWQRILVCFAGPLAGFIFLGLVFLGLWVWDPQAFPFYLGMAKLQLGLPLGNLHVPAEAAMPNGFVLEAFGQLFFINLLWGLINLLPVWPLDGGQISRDVCEGLSPDRGLTHSLGISLVVAGLLALHCFLVSIGQRLVPIAFGNPYAALLFALLAVQSYQLLQQAHAQRRWMDDRWDERY